MRPSCLNEHRFLWASLAAVLAVPAVLAQDNAQRELRQAVEKYMTGYASNTVEGYFDNYAKDITFWWPNGLRQTREAYYKTWADGLARGNNNVKSAVAEDVRIHAAPSGEAGVASFLWKIERAMGEPYALQTSATYFKRNGKWEIVHMHFNRVAPPAARPGQAGGGSGAPAARRPSPPAPSASGPDTEVSEVRDVIATLTRTYGSNDIEGYFALYAPHLTWWGPGGRNDKASYYKSWTESVQKTGGLAGAETDDLRIQVAPKGDLAVASYLLKVTRKNPGENRPPTVTYQMSPTMIKRGGKWEIVHLHFQVVPPPTAT
jgi:ketosteroid isomerase-like protein